MKCVYCKEDKPFSKYQNREHVIPQGFGKVATNNLILRNIVCDDCNTYFGEKIELFLCKDSFEGIERLRHGVKPKKSLKNSRRIKSKVHSGQLKGLIVKEKKLGENDRIDVEKELQAGFYNTLRRVYDYFEPNDIPTAEELCLKGYDLKTKKIEIIAEEGREYNFIVQHLASLGIKLKLDEMTTAKDISAENIEIESDILLDKTIMRGLCKIAFNYFAFTVNKPFVLNKAFDPIRRFIRFGEGKGDDFLGVNLPPILYYDQKLEKYGAKVTEGHLIILGWNGNRLVSKLSLFNSLTYGVEFCKNFDGVWLPINSGHHFNLKTKEISKLLSLSKQMLF